MKTIEYEWERGTLTYQVYKTPCFSYKGEGRPYLLRVWQSNPFGLSNVKEGETSRIPCETLDDALSLVPPRR